MDDPIFDPWSGETVPSPPEAAPTPRWRSPEPTRPTVPEPAAAVPSTPAPRASSAPDARARLAGTPGFLRTMAVPRLRDVAQRLEIAHHEATVEDMLDDSPPVVRLIMRPWRGPLEPAEDVHEGHLELGIEMVESVEHITVRYEVPSSDSPLRAESVPAARFSAAWLEGRTLALLSYLLERA